MENSGELIITPTALVYGGDALGRLPDGRAVFVPFVIPGETARVSVWEEKRGHARASLLEILQPSAQRIAPPCPHFMHCGGCHYQHLSYPEQLAAKAEILREQLQRIGGLSQVPLQPIVASPHPYNYRNHVQFHLDAGGKLGYQAARSNQVIPITECHLPETPLNEIWPRIDLEPIPGLERLSLRLGAGEEVQLILESNQPQPLQFSVEELPVSAVHLSPTGSIVLAGSETLWMDILDQAFQVSAGSFFQVNTPMAEAMVRHLLAILPLQPNMTLLDLYCGVGLFSLFLAPRVSRLIGVEVSATACRDFAANLDRFDHVELYEAPVEAVLKQINFHPDLILVDPPRAGLGQAVLDGLFAQGARWLAYVSCDPSTLARDARRLSAAGYNLKTITPFDLFPQTYHIESISLWEKTQADSA